MKRIAIAMLLLSSPALAADTYDQFGVKEFVSTCSGCREWFLPATQLSTDPMVYDENSSTNIVPVSCGEYNAVDQVRLSIISPDGGAWWRNVEMTGYFRTIGLRDGGPSPQSAHWELYARGERHTTNAVTNASINLGGTPAAGTATWPWYPYGVDGGTLDPHCLGTAYHGNAYNDGSYHLEKEIAHSDGYGSNKASGSLALVDGGYFGFKFVLRNKLDAGTVSLVTYIDANGDGGWVTASSVTDISGWTATNLDGCDGSEYGYLTNQLMTWAGPWVTFRSDGLSENFKWLSVREVSPAP